MQARPVGQGARPPAEVPARHRLALSVLMLAAIGAVTQAAPADAQELRERAEHEREVKLEKLETRLQPVMRDHDVDMWIIMTRENDPDPMVQVFGDYDLTASGHRNAYIFHDPGGDEPLERTILGTHVRGHLEPFFPDHFQSGHGYGEEGLEPHLREFVHERDPETIAINRSRTITMADGLSVEAHRYLVEAIGSEYEERLVSAEPIVIDYVSHRTPAELEIAYQASWITWNILKRGFSNEVISPGETTTLDVYWWLKSERHNQDLGFSFDPSVTVHRQGEENSLPIEDEPVIEPGDLLHTDFGVELMGLVTDQQKLTYVLRPDETEPPEGLRELFEESAVVAEIVAEELTPGVEGWRVKERAEERAQDKGIDALVYSHTQGHWVHGAGAWAIFDWPERYGIHPREPVRSSEIWSVEFSVTGSIPEWDGQTVSLGREEDGYVDEDGDFHWLAGPQEELWTVRSR